jgi:hypothetical protein
MIVVIGGPGLPAELASILDVSQLRVHGIIGVAVAVAWTSGKAWLA